MHRIDTHTRAEEGHLVKNGFVNIEVVYFVMVVFMQYMYYADFLVLHLILFIWLVDLPRQNYCRCCEFRSTLLRISLKPAYVVSTTAHPARYN